MNMAKKHELEIEIKPDGEIKVHVQGMKGKSCDEVVKIFESEIGEIKDVQRTSEYYEPDKDVGIHIRDGK